MAAMSAPERAQFLSRVLGYERLRAAQDRLKEKRSALRARLDALRAGLPDLAELDAAQTQAERTAGRGPSACGGARRRTASDAGGAPARPRSAPVGAAAAAAGDGAGARGRAAGRRPSGRPAAAQRVARLEHEAVGAAAARRTAGGAVPAAGPAARRCGKRPQQLERQAEHDAPATALSGPAARKCGAIWHRSRNASRALPLARAAGRRPCEQGQRGPRGPHGRHPRGGGTAHRLGARCPGRQDQAAGAARPVSGAEGAAAADREGRRRWRLPHLCPPAGSRVRQGARSCSTARWRRCARTATSTSSGSSSCSRSR